MHYLFCAIAGLFLIGLPLTETWQILCFGMLCLFLFLGTIRPLERRKLSIIAVLLLCVGILKVVFPPILIEEGQQLLLPLKGESGVYQQLPTNIRKILIGHFLKYHPQSSWCDPKKGGCWTSFREPSRIFAVSSETVWNQAKYSRVVSHIDFQHVNRIPRLIDLEDFPMFNFYSDMSEISRENAPFYTVYEIKKDMQGGAFSFQGHAWIEDQNGNVRDLSSMDKHYRLQVEPSLYGSRIWFGYFGIGAGALEVRYSDRTQELLQFCIRIFKILSLLIILLLSFYLRFDLAASIALFFLPWLLTLLREPNFIFVYPGGNDGMIHAAFGRDIFNKLIAFNWSEAFRSIEGIYYYMPGLRYFISLDLLFFGETRGAYYLIVVMLPVLLYRFWIPFMSRYFALCLPLLLIFGSRLNLDEWMFTLDQWGNLQIGGFPEPLGVFFLIVGMCFLMKWMDTVKEKGAARSAFLASFMFSLSVFTRPNYCIATFLLVLTSLFMVVVKEKVPIISKQVIYFIAGFSFSSIMLVHNWIYGHALVLFTTASQVTTAVKPSEYLSLLTSLEALTKIQNHLGIWLQTNLHLPALLSVLILPILFRKHFPNKIILLIVGIIGLHIPLLFWINHARYQMAAWLLTFMSLPYILGISLRETLLIVQKMWRNMKKKAPSLFLPKVLEGRRFPRPSKPPSP